MELVTVLVVADPATPALRRLAVPPAGVRFVVDQCEARLLEAAPQAAAALVWWQGAGLLERILAAAPGMRWIHSVAAGVDRLLSPTVAAHPAVLTNSRGVFSAALAEFALGAMLHFEKSFDRMRRAQLERRWDPFEVGMLRGRTLGVLGYGDIGRATAARAHALGMKLLAHRRRPELSRQDPLEAELVRDRRELCARSDYLLVAAPLTPDTRHIVGHEEFAHLRDGAVLVNVGRGALVDEVALVAALETGRLRGAALDVFETEPLPTSHPLWRFDNVLVSPHCADRTATWLDEALDFFLENLRQFASGGSLSSVVDKTAGY